MHSHLVTVEVRIESRTNKRMQLDSLTFHQDGFKRLNTQSMQCRGAVQHNGMLFDNILQNVPYLRIQSFHQLFGIFNILGNASGHQFLHNEGLKQLDCHLLRQTALINFQFGTYDDNASS